MTKSKGGRPATGWVRWRRPEGGGEPRWHTQITLADGTRSKWIALDPNIPKEDFAGAKAGAKAVSDEARLIGAVPETTRETAKQWFERFHNYKEARGLSSVEDMRGYARNWILPGIETKDMRAITREDVQAIVLRLDRAIEAWTEADGVRGEGRASPSTAQNVWGHLTHALGEAVSSKDPTLCVLKESPATNVRGPESGPDREGPILYSSEVTALLSGLAADEGERDVPLYRRIVYAVAVYVKARRSELAALTAADVSLEHQTISISKQLERTKKPGEEAKGTKKTKTKRSRTVDIEPHLRPLVEWLVKHPQGKGGRLLRVPPAEDYAEKLRADLWTVGVRDDRLHTKDSTRTQMTGHCLRDTGLTHMAIRGDSPVIIQWAAGHTDFKMTQGYIDRGRVEARRIGKPLPPLPFDFLAELRKGSKPAPEGLASVSLASDTVASKFAFSLANGVTPTGIEPVLPT